jgi:Leucine-rich repeat (LRR) protein
LLLWQFYKTWNNLDLSENDIEVVNGWKTASLKELYLNSNRISDVSLLGKSCYLEVLDVSENEISKINGWRSEKAEALYLSSNKISELTLISS